MPATMNPFAGLYGGQDWDTQPGWLDRAVQANAATKGLPPRRATGKLPPGMGFSPEENGAWLADPPPNELPDNGLHDRIQAEDAARMALMGMAAGPDPSAYTQSGFAPQGPLPDEAGLREKFLNHPGLGVNSLGAQDPSQFLAAKGMPFNPYQIHAPEAGGPMHNDSIIPSEGVLMKSPDDMFKGVAQRGPVARAGSHPVGPGTTVGNMHAGFSSSEISAAADKSKAYDTEIAARQKLLSQNARADQMQGRGLSPEASLLLSGSAGQVGQGGSGSIDPMRILFPHLAAQDADIKYKGQMGDAAATSAAAQMEQAKRYGSLSPETIAKLTADRDAQRALLKQQTAQGKPWMTPQQVEAEVNGQLPPINFGGIGAPPTGQPAGPAQLNVPNKPLAPVAGANAGYITQGKKLPEIIEALSALPPEARTPDAMGEVIAASNGLITPESLAAHKDEYYGTPTPVPWNPGPAIFGGRGLFGHAGPMGSGWTPAELAKMEVIAAMAKKMGNVKMPGSSVTAPGPFH